MSSRKESTSRAARSRIYDGALYAHIIDPMLDGLHEIVARQIEPNSRVVDACCGTGALAAKLAKTATEVVGVELSPAMIARARDRFDGEHRHVSFILGDVAEVLADFDAGHFDVATLSMALHEMPPRGRTLVLQELARVARRVVCVDYLVPMPWNFAGLRNRLLEVAAGSEHFRGFRDFTRRGGLAAITDDAGLAYNRIRLLDGGSLEVGEIRAR
jgi:demethylmenaquinone methyltransferase/2-methoxy-6-polyprenyl-1,4-benzoquinol methylase